MSIPVSCVGRLQYISKTGTLWTAIQELNRLVQSLRTQVHVAHRRRQIGMACQLLDRRNVRLVHLGYLLALLDTARELSARTEVGSPRLEAFHLAENVGDRAGTMVERDAISSILETELRRRFDLTTRAVRVLRDDSRPANPGLEELEALARLD